MTAPAEKKPSEARPGLSEVTPLASPTTQGSTKAHAQAVRKNRSRKLVRRLMFFVLLPTTLATAYYAGVASEQFESFSSFAVQSSELRPTLGMDGLLATLGSASGAGHDALVVR